MPRRDPLTLWLSQAGPDADVVLASRVRLGRNLADYPFAPAITDDEIELMTEQVCGVVAERLSGVGDDIAPAALTGTERIQLRERRVVDDEVPHRLFLAGDETLAIQVGVVDHLRLVSLGAGLQLRGALRKVWEIDRELESELNYAVSLDLGYLSTEILNLGTAMRASVLLYLPALASQNRITSLTKALADGWLALRPDELHDLGGVDAPYFRLSNIHSLGEDEASIVAKLEEQTGKLVHYERVAREELLAQRREEIADSVHRAFGILRYAQSLPAAEATQLLSQVRLGIVMGLIDGVTVETVTSLLFLSQNGHVMKSSPEIDDVLEGEEPIDVARAVLLREHLTAA